MVFKNILVAVDGSNNSQTAADYAFWLADKLDADVTGQYIVDARLADLFIEPAFAEELGFGRTVEASEKVFSALRKIGKEVLELFSEEARVKGIPVHTILDEGHIVEEILSRGKESDLIVLGHRGKNQPKTPTGLVLGSVAERVASESDRPVLISFQPVEKVKQILVAYDGSESARGALAFAENLALETECQLKAVTVIRSVEQKNEAKLLVQEGESFLRKRWPQDVFSIYEGTVADAILTEARASKTLLVIGAYGFANPNETVLGSTTNKIIRHTQTSVLIYRPVHPEVPQKERKETAGLAPAS